MPIAIEIEHRETDQVFSYYHGEKMLHFNATLLARIHAAMPRAFRMLTLNLTSAEYDLCMTHRGIEEPKVAALPETSVEEPGYGVLFDDKGTFTIVDGHHRLVRRYREGKRTMDLWVTTDYIWQHCLVEYTDEGNEQIAASMPARVENAPLLPTAATLHPRDTKS